MFTMPENIAALDIDALRAASEEALAEAREIVRVDDADLTDEQIVRAQTLMGNADELNAAVEQRTAAEAERAERLSALRSRVEEPAEDPDEDTTPTPAEGEEVEGEQEPAVEPEPEVTPESEIELVTASAARGLVAKAARRAPAATAPIVEEQPAAPRATLIASANVPGFDSGAELTDFTAVSEAFLARSRGFRGSKAQDRFDRYGVARIEKPATDFSLDNKSATEQMAIVLEAARESRLPGGSLVAAGGWCSPSETLYDSFLELETVDGILSIPEVTWARGGISWTPGPSYGDLAADWGFLQTEAQAIAGTLKECYEVECPEFDEVRLDAIGFCIKAGILTNTTYPELVRRVLEIGAVAHAHKVNAQTIARIVALMGPAVNYTELGGGATDVLGALELQAEVLRYRYSMAVGASMEVVLPAWARLVIRQDLANRNGVDLLSVSDAQINAYFAVRNLAVQWVYDYQPLATTGATVGQALPTTVEALIYPAGSYIKGTTPVIDLDTVYDSVGLSTNTYTAAFFEEGLAVANMGAGGIRVAIDINTLGASGYPAIGAGAGVSIAA